jgi:hypothetical protein
MVSTMTEHFERQTERNKKRSDEDYDEGVEEQLVDEDDEVETGLLTAYIFLNSQTGFRSINCWLRFQARSIIN